MSHTITYYYSLVSPWTYLGHARLGEIATHHGATIDYVPVTVSAVFPRTGGLPLPKRAPERQAYRLIELKRWPQLLGIPLNVEPKHFPTDDRPAARMALSAKAQGHGIAGLSLAILRACWAEERDIADLATLREIADACGLDGQALLDESETQAGQERLDDACEQAVAAGCFGVPWYEVAGEPFWGQDRLELVEKKLAGAF
ncbi:MAG: 2-hydroxychromene-2-carboxylate isomerase [Halomonas sp.]|jgi:2-hydroxychromene-2-carboxylate isomerase|uniref:2-hydroxychromene-2-carboxylate isomerase n=1 Tax=Billgrantia tianxiuensis TaxID=2497861 RepID=A0A6I6SKP2_9GAMM|nr:MULTISPECIES: 2-hydroxychromene-2-carboxylate isomerase [Halomonas]MCE8033694.1 2-hydroxychromene-2-carboxylate isomerase [Halomonas sp. MCCC 1A11057]MDX5433051.1 2-hydroxychromene-2-carboxylate isomerase [Halomonas sp.]QHC51278.1 2-hydroxychromene-2-carboxylate isomerase [Halomonas tianxiuensis]